MINAVDASRDGLLQLPECEAVVRLFLGVSATLPRARAALGEEAFALAWEAGGAMTPEQAIADALEAQGGRPARLVELAEAPVEPAPRMRSVAPAEEPALRAPALSLNPAALP